MADQTLTLKLTADGSGLTATLESATGGVRKFTTGMKDAERQTGDSGAKIESTFAGIKDSLGDIAAAVGLAFSVDKITGWVRGAIEGASRIQNLSQTLGIGTQTLQAMSYAAGLTDTSLDSLAGTLSRLERASLEARDGNVQTAAAFTAVGISVEQIRKLSPDQLFEATAKGISQLQDGSTKTAVTMQLMGRGAAENIPFINKMGNELEGLKDKAAQVGVVLSGVDQAALAAFSDRTNELGQDVKGLSNQLAIALLPALTSVVGQLQRAAENGNLKAFFRDVGDAAEFLADHIDAIVTVAKTLLEIKIATWAIEGAGALRDMATAAASSSTAILSLRGAVSVVGAAITGWNIGTWLREQFSIVAQIGQVLGAALATVQTVLTTPFELASQAIKTIVDSLVAYIRTKIADAFQSISQSMASSFNPVASQMAASFASMAASIRPAQNASDTFAAGMRQIGSTAKGALAFLKDVWGNIGADIDAAGKKTTAAADTTKKGLDGLAQSAGSYNTNLQQTIALQQSITDAFLKDAAAIAQIRGQLDPIAKIYSDYTAGIIEAGNAYQQEIAKLKQLGASEAQYALAKQNVIDKTGALNAVLKAQLAQMQKDADVIGQMSKKMSEDSALVGLRDRARAQKQAVQDAVNAWLKLPDAVRIAQVEQGKFNADLVNNLGEQAGALQGLQQAMTDFSGESPFEKFTQDLKSLQDELKKVGNATSDAFDPARAKQLEIVIGDIRQQMLVYATQSIGQSIGALQSLAGEGTKAYKELAVAQDALNLVTAIGAIVNQGLGDPYTAFARIAAMAAIMAKLVHDIGSIGGGGGPSAQSAQVRQANQGTGTVLGDAKVQSDSIAKAMDITAKATTALVGINRGMLNALQSLQAALGSAGTQLAQGAGNATFPGLSSGNAFNNLLGSLDPLGGDPITKAIGNFLFGGSKKVIDQGIVIAGGTLQDMLNKIVVGAYQTVHTSGGLFSSGSTKDNTASVSDDFTKQFQLVIQSISDAVKQGATALGILPADIQAAMDQFKIAETHISLQGLSAEDQQKALEAVFSQIFDGLAKSVVPFIGQFQKVGEGLGETLVRVATEVQVTQEAIKQLGFAVNTTDPEKFAQIADGLATAAGGIDNFISGMQSFTDKFASDGDKFKYEQDSLNSAFDQLGLKLPTTRDGMMALMQSLDASTASGQKQIATLLQLTDVADAYYTALENQQKAKLDYSQEMQGINADLGKVSPLTIQLGQIRQWSIDESKKLNDLAKSAGLAGAAESDLARVQEDAAKKMAEAIAALKQSALDDAAKLGYVDTLDTLNAKIAALQTGASSAAASVSQAASSFDALSLEIGDNSPYSDSKKLALALQGLRAGTVTADQVLQIGRRLYASGDDYNKLFEQVLSIAGSAASAGAAPNAGSSGGTESGNLAALMAERDKLLAAQRKDEAQALAQKIADLAQGEHETVQQVAQELGINLADIGKDLGYSQDKIADYITSLEKEDLSGTFTNGAGDITDAVSSGADRVVNAIYDAAGKPVPAGATLPDVTRPTPGTSITPAPIAPSTPPPGGGITPGDGQHQAQVMQFLAYLPAIAAATGATADTSEKTHRALSDAARERAAQARRSLA